MREGIIIDVAAADRARLEAIAADRNSPQKHVWRARIILLSADGLGTAEIMRRTGKAKPTIWRWQEHFMREGVAGLLRDKTRPARIPLLPPTTVDRVIERTMAEPAGKAVHVILDNYGAHKHPKVMAWLERHPRFVFHFTPTSCSWLNAVEGFLATLTKRRLKRGVFRSIVDLQAAINRFVAEANKDPKPFVWTADPDRIIAAARRGHQALESIH